MTKKNDDLKALPKLKPAIKKRWLKALRSGKYEQANGKLCAVDPQTGKPVAYCCLGVLADVVKSDKALNLKWDIPELDEWDREVSPGELYGEFATIDHEEGSISDSRVIRDHVLANPAAYDFYEDVFYPLIIRNDGQPTMHITPHTFDQIADIIEEWM